MLNLKKEAWIESIFGLKLFTVINKNLKLLKI